MAVTKVDNSFQHNNYNPVIHRPDMNPRIRSSYIQPSQTHSKTSYTALRKFIGAHNTPTNNTKPNTPTNNTKPNTSNKQTGTDIPQNSSFVQKRIEEFQGTKPKQKPALPPKPALLPNKNPDLDKCLEEVRKNALFKKASENLK